jgi:hypothetical protein
VYHSNIEIYIVCGVYLIDCLLDVVGGMLFEEIVGDTLSEEVDGDRMLEVWLLVILESILTILMMPLENLEEYKYYLVYPQMGKASKRGIHRLCGRR